MYNMYYENGVIIVPNVVAEGDKATVLYKGILSNSGANHIYMHMGYGENWQNTADIQMRKSKDGFEAEISDIRNADTLNLAFKDCADNWDNNSGRNYSFEVQRNRRA